MRARAAGGTGLLMERAARLPRMSGWRALSLARLWSLMPGKSFDSRRAMERRVVFLGAPLRRAATRSAAARSLAAQTTWRPSLASI